MRRFSDAEVKLARRISEKEDRERWERACQPPVEESVRDQMQRIMDAPLQPSYGPTPPWWVQALAEEDQNMVWVRGGGWFKKDLWEDLLATQVDMEALEKELEDE